MNNDDFARRGVTRYPRIFLALAAVTAAATAAGMTNTSYASGDEAVMLFDFMIGWAINLAIWYGLALACGWVVRKARTTS